MIRRRLDKQATKIREEERLARLFNLTPEQFKASQEVKDGYIVRQWQHEETGFIVESPTAPSSRYFAIKTRCSNRNF